MSSTTVTGREQPRGLLRPLTAVAAAAIVVPTGAFLTLLGPWEHSNALTQLASVAIDPGWRVALWIYPQGVHAGLPFLVLSLALNWVAYAVSGAAVVIAWARLRRRVLRQSD